MQGANVSNQPSSWCTTGSWRRGFTISLWSIFSSIIKVEPPTSSPTPTYISPTVKNCCEKAIFLSSLSLTDTSKPSSSKANKLTYSVITHVIISLDAAIGDCTVSTAAEYVKRQIGFEVVLLNCKLCTLHNNEGTSGTDFGKSTRKIIAVAHTSYHNFSGDPEEELGQFMATDDSATQDSPVQPTKKPRLEASMDSELLHKIDEKIDEVIETVGIFDHIKKIF